MRAPGSHKRVERATMMEAAREFNALEERYYYTDTMSESQRRFVYKQMQRAQVRLNAATLAYCLGAKRVSVEARLKRRAKRRIDEAQTTMVAA